MKVRCFKCGELFEVATGARSAKCKCGQKFTVKFLRKDIAVLKPVGGR